MQCLPDHDTGIQNICYGGHRGFFEQSLLVLNTVSRDPGYCNWLESVSDHQYEPVPQQSCFVLKAP